MLAALLLRPYGFYGIPGLLGVIVGLIVACVVIGVLWKIFTLIAAKFGLDGFWIQIAGLIVGLLIFLWFMNVIFGLFAL